MSCLPELTDTQILVLSVAALAGMVAFCLGVLVERYRVKR